MKCTTLDSYMLAYGPLLGRQAAEAMRPLHIPGRDAPSTITTLRKPFEAQAHVIAAGAKALDRQRSIMLVAEMGCGKSLMGQLIAHAHAKGQPYRGIVFCPGHLVRKWKREILETIPAATVTIIQSVSEVLHLAKRVKPTAPEWFVVSKETAKLEPRWRAAFIMRPGEEVPRCPKCGVELMREVKDGKDTAMVGIMPADLERKRTPCPSCKEPCWTFTPRPRKWPTATYVHRKLKGVFKYLVLDEVHECKGGAEVAQANAIGSLAAACEKVIAMTGTLSGGKAEELRPLLFRLAPRSLVAEHFGWSEQLPFTEKYGRIETRITTRSGGSDNRQSRGRASRNAVKQCKPGIMPTLFGRHLIDKCIFLGLGEVAANLPLFKECIRPVELDQLDGEYKFIEGCLRDAIRQLVKGKGPNGCRLLLGPMLNCLLAWPDHPFDWDPVGYTDKDGFHTVVVPPNLDKAITLPKERELIDALKMRRAMGRQSWVFVEYTQEIRVLQRLRDKLKAAGLSAAALESAVKPAEREEWIAKNAKCDVIISHPGLVKTGLDLFDKGGKYNFSTLVFYEQGYSAYTMRQASRRAWRIGQSLDCEVLYFFYGGTAQARCMDLMGQKIAAAEALEGKFSTEGMAAMGGEDSDVKMALVKSLADSIDDGADASRSWEKVGAVDPLAGAFDWLSSVECDDAAMALFTG